MVKRVFVLLGLLAFIALDQPSIALEKKPYKNVLVIYGGGPNAATYLGIIAGLIKSGWRPDLILATCGTAIVAMYTQVYPWVDYRYQITVREKSLYQFLELSQISYRDTTPGTLVRGAGAMYFRNLVDFSSETPALWGRTLTKLPESLRTKEMASVIPPEFFNAKFRSDEIRIPVILGATKVLFQPSAVGTPKKGKLYQETLMTSVDVAKVLRNLQNQPGGFDSPIFSANPSGYFAKEFSVRDDVFLVDAVRAAISDPYLMNPAKIGDDYYVAGNGNLILNDYARALGENVAMVYSGYPPHEEQMANGDVYSYDYRARFMRAMNLPADIWIDNSDISKINEKFGFEGKPNVTSDTWWNYVLFNEPLYRLERQFLMSDQQLRRDDRIYARNSSVIRSGLPPRHEFSKYVDKSEQLYRYGYERAVEALLPQNLGKQSHIREPHLGK